MDKIPWFGPLVGEAEAEALLAVVASGYLNDGPVTRAFETELAAFLGVRHAVAVTSGTVALSMSLMALGIGPGDEVIVPDLTFIATANAVRMVGAEVRLTDVEPQRFTLNLASAEAAVGPRTRAIIAVDVNGRAPDYDALEALCRTRGLDLICDSAEGLGSRYGGRYLGTFGRTGCFSFSANKTVTSGQGGMIVTDDDDLQDRLRELKDQGRRHGGTGGNDLHPTLGFNFKYTSLQASVARAQFANLETRLDAMRRRDRLYREALSGIADLTPPPERSNDGEVCQWTDIVSQRRAEIVAALGAIGAGSRPFWLPLHRQEPYRQSDDGFVGAVSASDHGLWLPSHLAITAEQIERVCDAIRRALA